MSGNLPPGCTDADIDRAANDSAGPPEPEPCGSCNGHGEVVVSAVHETYATCEACNGTGVETSERAEPIDHQVGNVRITGPTVYYCCSPDCPGERYPASEMPHGGVCAPKVKR